MLRHVISRNGRLTELARRTGNGLIITDTQRKIEWTNVAFSKITGYSASEALGKKPGDLLQGPQTDPQSKARIHEAVSQHKGICEELINYRKDGSPYAVRVTIEPTFDPQQRHTGFMAIETEVTQQRKVETELREERALLSSILTHLPYYVFWKDCNSTYLGCNQAFAVAAGVTSPDQVIGKTDFDFPFTRDEAQKYRTDDALIIRSGEAKLHIEETQRMADGQDYSLITSKVPLRDSKGKIIGVLGIYQDVTEHRQLQQQLAQAQRLESIGQLAAGKAHEINTPTQYVSDNLCFLTEQFHSLMAIVSEYRQAMDGNGTPVPWSQRQQTIQAMLEKLDYDFLKREIPEALSQSLDGLNRVAMIVRAMKEFSHPGTTNLEPADINRAITSTVEVSRNRWKYSAEVQLDLAADLPLVPCLLGELNQVLLNLIVNAADSIAERLGSAGDKRGLITITTRKVDADRVEIRIQDNGKGIPEDVRARIFTPFFTTKAVGKGTGQGLALGRNVIVKKHNGELTFESEPGKGTTFVIRLPIGKVEPVLPLSLEAA